MVSHHFSQNNLALYRKYHTFASVNLLRCALTVTSNKSGLVAQLVRATDS